MKTALIVDDEYANCELLKIGIISSGCKPIIAYDGNTAIGIYKKRYEEIDIVFMDVLMPGTNGVETLKKIREFEKEINVKKTPVIMLTALLEGEFDIPDEADGCFYKPIKIDILLKACEKLC